MSSTWQFCFHSTFVGSLKSGNLPQLQHTAISHQCCSNNAILHTRAILEHETRSLKSKLLQLFFLVQKFVTTNSDCKLRFNTLWIFFWVKTAATWHFLYCFSQVSFLQVTNFFMTSCSSKDFGSGSIFCVVEFISKLVHNKLTLWKTIIRYLKEWYKLCWIHTKALSNIQVHILGHREKFQGHINANKAENGNLKTILFWGYTTVNL